MVEEQRLSEEAVCRLVEIATDWRNPRGSSVYEGRAGSLDIEFNYSEPSSEYSTLNRVEIDVKSGGQLIGSTDSQEEKYMSLYRNVQKEGIKKNIKEIEQARQDGFAEAKRILEGFWRINN